MRLRILPLLIVLALPAAAGRQRSVRHPALTPTSPTFSNEVVRIFQANSGHGPGQCRYHPHHGDPQPDRTELGIYFSEHPSPQEMRIFPIINNTFTIPPNDPNYRVDATFPIPTPFPAKIWFVAPHMHLLGRKMQVDMKLPNGESQCLIRIDDWDFNWQGAYRFETPIDVPVGTRLAATAYYDNSSSNPRNPNNPPQSVSWGEATTDEMCIAFLGVTIE